MEQLDINTSWSLESKLDWMLTKYDTFNITFIAALHKYENQIWDSRGHLDLFDENWINLWMSCPPPTATSPSSTRWNYIWYFFALFCVLHIFTDSTFFSTRFALNHKLTSVRSEMDEWNAVKPLRWKDVFILLINQTI